MLKYEFISKSSFECYENFVKSHYGSSFMQSIYWAGVKINWEQEVCVVRRHDKIVGGFSALIRSVGPFSFIYAPRGPVCDFSDAEVVLALMNGAGALMKKRRAVEFVFDPAIAASDSEAVAALTNAGCEFTAHDAFDATIQPRYNYIVELQNHDMSSLMGIFARETRYYIRYAIKKGVECRQVSVEKLDDFFALYRKTAERQGFNARPKSYFKNLMEALPNNAKLYMCYHDSVPLCGGLAIQYKGTTSHVYGASSAENRNLRATYLLQWTMMLWALEGGCHTYDMQGVAPSPKDNAQLYNVLAFKKNFTGRIVETAGEFKIGGNPFLRKIAKLSGKI